MPKAQTHSGGLSGSVYFSADEHGGAVAIKNYSDWSGVKIYANKDIPIAGINLEPNIRRSHDFDVTIETPVWDTTNFKIKGLGVRDGILQWGLWLRGAGVGCYWSSRTYGGSYWIVDKD